MFPRYHLRLNDFSFLSIILNVNDALMLLEQEGRFITARMTKLSATVSLSDIRSRSLLGLPIADV